LGYAIEAMAAVTEEERVGLLTVRGQEILGALPPAARALPAGRDFRDLLMITAGPEGSDL
jgi:hypothetical protein